MDKQDTNEETSEASPETREKRADSPVLRLVNLLVQFEAGEDKKKTARNLFNHVTAAFPDAQLAIMSRIAHHDKSESATYLYAKAALQKSQIKLARKIIQPLLDAPKLEDETLLLAARICGRVEEMDGAKKLLERIPADSPLAARAKEVMATLGTEEGVERRPRKTQEEKQESRENRKNKKKNRENQPDDK